ncbi:Crp/Fnr family transcriptional regulator [Hymenobacter armeniacus]|uniref:Crp/Fnr family transcriptional regulator n=1 Tax=Hymenobacter armeniacus TaxID=2771358 RepID=A0ABR8JUV1_9BACT|nr:Crp/Fnr family transcriptional regulator [Hymenobacter armeniacus]MBD2723638.1 Crp/Fnr family transcriptional regulator [Hymenobacter armeniacus]
MSPLVLLIRRYAALTEQEATLIAAEFEPVDFRKDDYLLRAGRVCEYYFFVERGGCRIFHEVGEREITGWLAFEGNLFTELQSFKSGRPSRFSIQALEDMRVWRLPRPAHFRLFQAVPGWQAVVREVWEEAFLRLVDGILAFQTETAEQRYRKLAGVAQRVPLKHLASFLGITPTSLSRLRAKK